MFKTRVAFSLLALGSIGILLSPIPNHFVILWALLILGFLFAMSMNIRANFFVKSINKTKENQVLLTFDDGPDSQFTPQVLDLLKKYEVRAMFFLIGNKIKGNETLVQRIHQEGHLLGSHSFSHLSSMGIKGYDWVLSDIQKGHEALLEILPDVGMWYRPPFGVTNPAISRALKELELQSVGWSCRSLDTVQKNPEKLLNRILSRVKGTDIVLLHDTQSQTLEILEELIVTLKNKKNKLNAGLE